MTKRDKATRRQLALIEDLFAGELDERDLLEKHRIDLATYRRWRTDPAFLQALDDRVATAYSQGKLILARYAPLAAAKLVALTESDSQETARKACLDIISMQPARKPALAGQDAPSEAAPPPSQLSPETAGRLLAVLAESQEQ